MKKLFLSIIVFFSILHADIPSQMVQLYQKGAYSEVCSIGIQHFKQIHSNEAYVSLYAFGCLKADQIDCLNTPTKLLNQSPEARINASYFSLLIMQKKLLLQALYDNYPLKSLKLPTSSSLLSKVFDLYCKSPQSSSSIKKYTDPNNPRQTYNLYTVQINGYKTFAIDVYYDRILATHHVYQ
ncbi:MAG: hypothetical protein Q8K81_03455 [Sulfuricurvum sp.]|nr:hypothetical protein [Sulfuricurvum sp.]